jgi:hypothetical protein
MITAPNIQDLIELTIFHAIRGECVNRGYLPDITAYEDSPTGYNQYQADIKSIVDSEKGFAIEVFNNSNPQYKGLKKPPRIVIISENFLPGTTGVDGTEMYEKIGDKFRGYTLPNLLASFTFRVHLIGSTAKQIRELTSILSKAIPFRGFKSLFLSEYPEEGVQTFFINNIGFGDIGMASDDLLERVYRYEIEDLLNSELITYTTTHVKLVEISLASHINQEILGEPDHTSITPPRD